MPKNPNVKRTEILLSMRLWAQAVACAKLERKKTRETGASESLIELCLACMDESGQENLHSDDGHELPFDECVECCRALGREPKVAAAPVVVEPSPAPLVIEISPEFRELAKASLERGQARKSIMEEMERFIDRHSVGLLLSALAEVCYGKYEHVLVNEGDAALAKAWAQLGARVDKVGTAVEGL
jgi:hypothetical protein